MSFVAIVRLFIEEGKMRERGWKGRWIDYLENLTTDLSEIFIDQ